MYKANRLCRKSTYSSFRRFITDTQPSRYSHFNSLDNKAKKIDADPDDSSLKKKYSEAEVYKMGTLINDRSGFGINPPNKYEHEATFPTEIERELDIEHLKTFQENIVKNVISYSRVGISYKYGIGDMIILNSDKESYTSKRVMREMIKNNTENYVVYDSSNFHLKNCYQYLSLGRTSQLNDFLKSLFVYDLVLFTPSSSSELFQLIVKIKKQGVLYALEPFVILKIFQFISLTDKIKLLISLFGKLTDENIKRIDSAEILNFAIRMGIDMYNGSKQCHFINRMVTGIQHYKLKITPSTFYLLYKGFENSIARKMLLNRMLQLNIPLDPIIGDILRERVAETGSINGLAEWAQFSLDMDVQNQMFVSSISELYLEQYDKGFEKCIAFFSKHKIPIILTFKIIFEYLVSKRKLFKDAFKVLCLYEDRYPSAKTFYTKYLLSTVSPTPEWFTKMVNSRESHTSSIANYESYYTRLLEPFFNSILLNKIVELPILNEFDNTELYRRVGGDDYTEDINVFFSSPSPKSLQAIAARYLDSSQLYTHDNIKTLQTHINYLLTNTECLQIDINTARRLCIFYIKRKKFDKVNILLDYFIPDSFVFNLLLHNFDSQIPDNFQTEIVECVKKISNCIKSINCSTVNLIIKIWYRTIDNNEIEVLDNFINKAIKNNIDLTLVTNEALIFKKNYIHKSRIDFIQWVDESRFMNRSKLTVTDWQSFFRKILPSGQMLRHERMYLRYYFLFNSKALTGWFQILHEYFFLGNDYKSGVWFLLAMKKRGFWEFNKRYSWIEWLKNNDTDGSFRSDLCIDLLERIQDCDYHLTTDDKRFINLLESDAITAMKNEFYREPGEKVIDGLKKPEVLSKEDLSLSKLSYYNLTRLDTKKAAIKESELEKMGIPELIKFVKNPAGLQLNLIPSLIDTFENIDLKELSNVDICHLICFHNMFSNTPREFALRLEREFVSFRIPDSFLPHLLYSCLKNPNAKFMFEYYSIKAPIILHSDFCLCLLVRDYASERSKKMATKYISRISSNVFPMIKEQN